jgi:hypothetical protein
MHSWQIPTSYFFEFVASSGIRSQSVFYRINNCCALLFATLYGTLKIHTGTRTVIHSTTLHVFAKDVDVHYFSFRHYRLHISRFDPIPKRLRFKQIKS